MAFSPPPSRGPTQIPNQNPTERAITTLLLLSIRHLCMKHAFDEHHGFIGKTRLKNALIQHLPITELQQVGFGETKVRRVLNELLDHGGLTDELIAESRRRKEEHDDRPSPIDVPPTDTLSITIPKQDGNESGWSHVETRGRKRMGSSGWTSTRSHTSSPHRHDEGNFALSTPRTFTSPWSGNPSPASAGTPFELLAELTSRPPTPERPDLNPTTFPTMLPISQQINLLTTLQNKLEAACYHFVRVSCPEVFHKKQAWTACPEAAELHKWIAEIEKVLRKEVESEKINSRLHGEFCKLLLPMKALRHDSVHRNRVSAEQILRHARAGKRLLELFQEIGYRGSNYDAEYFDTTNELKSIESELVLIQASLEECIERHGDGDIIDLNLNQEEPSSSRRQEQSDPNIRVVLTPNAFLTHGWEELADMSKTPESTSAKGKTDASEARGPQIP